MLIFILKKEWEPCLKTLYNRNFSYELLVKFVCITYFRITYLHFAYFLILGEATRLLAWLAKNSNSPSVVNNLVKANAFPYVITMLKSEHAVMQNEALIAVTMASKFCLSKDIV